MGRKMKNIVALLVILGLIYWQQSPAVRPAYAWDESCGEQNISPDRETAADSDGSWEEGNEISGGTQEGPSDGSGKKEPEGEPEGGGKDGTEEEPEGDGKDGTEEEPGTSGEDKDDTEEPPIECFKTVIPPEDGQNGYYKTRPEAEVWHNSERGVTRYCFTDSSGRREEGGLTEKDGSFKIRRERFLEGSNHLSVWMEDEAGKRVEEYALEDFSG